MTAHDPQLVFQGGLPWHFKRRADDTENADANYTANGAADDEADYEADDEAEDETGSEPDYSFADAVADEEEGVNPFAIAVVAAALVIGIGLGAGATALLMSSHHAHRPPTAVASRAQPPKPAPPAVAPSAPPVEVAAPAPAPAAKSAAPRAHRSAAAPTQFATACGASGGPRETMICAWPAIAAADREMRGAYRHALDVGVERGSLQASQDRWSIASDMAARRSPADLAAAYRRRIGELNTLAANEPPR